MNVHETYLVSSLLISTPPPPPPPTYICLYRCKYLCMYNYVHHNYTHYFLLLFQGQLSKGNKDRSWWMTVDWLIEKWMAALATGKNSYCAWDLLGSSVVFSFPPPTYACIDVSTYVCMYIISICTYLCMCTYIIIIHSFFFSSYKVNCLKGTKTDHDGRWLIG